MVCCKNITPNPLAACRPKKRAKIWGGARFSVSPVVAAQRPARARSAPMGSNPVSHLSNEEQEKCRVSFLRFDKDRNGTTY